MKIRVDNIPAKLDDHELMKLFVQYGQVSQLKIDKDQVSGKKQRTGTVEMRFREQGIKAVNNLNGYKIMGDKLSVFINE